MFLQFFSEYEDIKHEVRKNIERLRRKKAREEQQLREIRLIEEQKAIEQLRETERLEKIEKEKQEMMQSRRRAELEVRKIREEAILNRVRRESSYFIHLDKLFPNSKFAWLFVITPLFAFYTLPVLIFVFAYNAIEHFVRSIFNAVDSLFNLQSCN